MKHYSIKKDSTASFHNQVDYCVGTGRMDLALHKEYYDQLKMVQDEIGFRYIRGHGLFCKDMAIYQLSRARDGVQREEYNFTYLDQVMDMYQDLHIRPFIELGFMPERMASGEDTVFYWNGNITPPKDYEKWANLVKATLSHLMERYGEEEVLTWPVEVWNEPNLGSFWKDADMKEYFHLYEVTAKAVKEVHEKMRVGGPAICGVQDELWLKEFLDFVKEKKLPLDFITRHHYTSYVPEPAGHYGYIELHSPEYAFGCLNRSRTIIDSYPEFEGMELHITEFNTSYSPNAPIHDTCYNAAYLGHMLSKLGDNHESYSYWTFGDVFEEWGVPFTPFHGGFGLVANGQIAKPTFWTFAFYKKLQGECILRTEETVVVKRTDGTIYGVAWNPDHELSKKELLLMLDFELDGTYSLVTKTVDEEHGNPLKVWHDMGEPANPTREQTQLLKECAVPWIRSERLDSAEGKVSVELSLAKNAVMSFELAKICPVSDAGYDYERVLNQKVAYYEE